MINHSTTRDHGIDHTKPWMVELVLDLAAYPPETVPSSAPWSAAFKTAH